MSRGRSKDKSAQGRLLPRSPLSMPPSTNFAASPSPFAMRYPAGADRSPPQPSRFTQPANPYFLSAASSA
jgi:hypothetical protein